MKGLTFLLIILPLLFFGQTSNNFVIAKRHDRNIIDERLFVDNRHLSPRKISTKLNSSDNTAFTRKKLENNTNQANTYLQDKNSASFRVKKQITITDIYDAIDDFFEGKSNYTQSDIYQLINDYFEQ